MNELYKRFRPISLKTVEGQDAAVSSVRALLERGFPHATMVTGPSGVGKTTLGRIIKDALGCGDADYLEINSANFKGIDTVRQIGQQINLAPICGDCRIWFIDEAHKLTGDAQNAFLKYLEDTPRHAYFILATTEPQKLIKTIHTRCSEIKLKAMNPEALRRVCLRVIEKEKMVVSSDVLDEIAEAADGSARKALVVLEQIGYLEGDEAQLKAIQTTVFNKEDAFQLCRFLSDPRVGWAEVAALLSRIEDDPESVRYMVLGYARKVLLGGKGNAPRAFMVIDIFSKNFYDSKAAGLAAACYEVVTAKK